MTRQADRNAERQDPKGLGPEGMRAAVGGNADAPNTYPMDKTVEVSQAARDTAEEFFYGLDREIDLPDIENLLARFEATTRATQPEAALREALQEIAADEDGPDGEQRPKSYFVRLARAALKDHRHG